MESKVDAGDLIVFRRRRGSRGPIRCMRADESFGASRVNVRPGAIGIVTNICDIWPGHVDVLVDGKIVVAHIANLRVKASAYDFRP